MNTTINTSTKERNYLFDNYRALLIFCVVLGHVLRRKLGHMNELDAIYYFIYFFHMPAFIFISGYFSKNVNKSRELAFQSFMIPYLIFNAFFWLQDRIFYNEPIRGYHVFSSQWGLWFLLAVFVWKLFLKDIVLVRYILPISFIVGLLGGYSEEFSKKMALSRIIAFLPFFLLGYFCTEEHISKIRKIPKIISLSVLTGFGVLAYLCVKFDAVNKESLYMWKPYSKINEEMFSGITIRIMIYIIAIVISVCFLSLISTKKNWFSTIGQNSITVYILHLYLVSKIKILTKYWDADYKFIIFSILISALLTYVCSRPIVLKIYNYIMTTINHMVFKTVRN